MKYNQGQFQVPKAPMDFISMDLIGEFHPPTAEGYKYALTVICMLTGFTWCIPVKSKMAKYCRGLHEGDILQIWWFKKDTL